MDKIKKFLNKIGKNLYFKIIIITVIIILIILLLLHQKNDGMEQSGIDNVRYRVYTDGDWSKWSKNGVTVGNKESNINKVEIKMKDDLPTVNYYYNNDWYESNEKNNNITGLRIINSAYYLKKYDVCYRTYNNKNKWLNWSCNGSISGNIDEPITALEIKIIPKNIVKSDYLKNYIDNNSKMIGF